MKPIKRTLSFFIFSFTFFLFIKISSSYAQIEILTSSYSNFVLTLNLFQGDAEVKIDRILQDGSSCSHESELSISDMKNLSRAGYLIFDQSLEKETVNFFKKKFQHLKMIDSSTGLNFLWRTHKHGEGETREIDPHFYLSISNIILQMKNLNKIFSQAFPEKKKGIDQNALAYIQKLEALNDLSLKTKEIVKDKSVITSHNAFEYLGRDLSFKIRAGLYDTDEEDEELSAKKLKDLIDLIKKESIKTLFVESYDLIKKVKVLEEQTGIKIKVLDPIERNHSQGLQSLQREIQDKDYYLEMMKENLKVLSTI